MKIGLENLTQSKVSKTVASIGVEEASIELSTVYEVTSNLEELRAVITAHGIDDSLIALFGKEISTLKSKKVEASIEGIGGAIKSGAEKIGKAIAKMFEALKNFFMKLFDFNSKLLASAKKEATRIQKLKSPEWDEPKQGVLVLTDKGRQDLVTLKSVDTKLAKKLIVALKSGKWTKVNSKGFEDFEAYADKKLNLQIDATVAWATVACEKVNPATVEVTSAKAYVTKIETSLKDISAIKKDLDNVKVSKVEVDEGVTLSPVKCLRGASKAMVDYNKLSIKLIKERIKMWKNITEESDEA